MTLMLSFVSAVQQYSVGESYTGPPPSMMSFSDMGFMAWPITLCLVMVAALAARAAMRIGAGDSEQKVLARGTIDGGLFWGAYAAVLGVLGTVVGFMVAAQSVEIAGRVEGPLVWGGIKVALSTTVYGLMVFLVAALSWFGLRAWHRRAVLGGSGGARA